MTSYKVGDKVIMKKTHPCGNNEWEIIRYGADIKIQCLKCSRVVMLDRVQFTKRVKKKIDTDQNQSIKH